MPIQYRNTNSIRERDEMSAIWDRMIAEFASVRIPEDDMWDLDFDKDQQPYYSRGQIVIDGLEPVSEELLSRYEAVRGEDHPQGRALCVVCCETLGPGYSYGPEDGNPTKPTRTENDSALPSCATIPKVVALPCIHLFHSECLAPWLDLKTTCPACRFDLDPNSSTLKCGNARRTWVPPAKGILEAWVKDEEEKKRPLDQRRSEALRKLKSMGLWPNLCTQRALRSGYDADENVGSCPMCCSDECDEGDCCSNIPGAFD